MWTSGHVDQWTSGHVHQWTCAPVDMCTSGPVISAHTTHVRSEKCGDIR
jgi:hypothetical protein